MKQENCTKMQNDFIHFIDLIDSKCPQPARNHLQFLIYFGSFPFRRQIIYSSRCDVVVDFTRDYDVIRQALYSVEHYDKTCLGNALQTASSMIISNWGTQNYCQVNCASMDPPHFSPNQPIYALRPFCIRRCWYSRNVVSVWDRILCRN